MAVSIRRTTTEDLDLIVPLFDAYRQFYRQPSDPDLARTFLADRFRHYQSVIFLAVDDAIDDIGSALGFTQLYPSFSSGLARPIYILNDLYVIPAARRRKIARRLLETAAEFGRQSGAARLGPSTALDNTPARALYESAGWHQDKVFCTYALPLET
jgi:ribosomal protein S18 acetylase RimI-like enzyme